MSAATLLSRLEKVKKTGPGRWLAKCPAHDDRRASLAIRELDDGRLLLHDFAGCTVHEIVGAVGMDMADLFPPRPDDPTRAGKSERRPFPAADILRAISFEATIVALAGAAIIAGEPFTQFDKERLFLAVGRIRAALSAGGLDHD